MEVSPGAFKSFGYGRVRTYANPKHCKDNHSYSQSYLVVLIKKISISIDLLREIRVIPAVNDSLNVYKKEWMVGNPCKN
jgi:hypothetical protein